MITPTNIHRSAAWSAFGDALGFISELTSASRLRERVGSGSLDKTLPWKKVVGGRDGVPVDLPAGAYSDDTQLRLAVSRSINAQGTFDVEAFAKVELPLWLSYQLGAGRSTQAGATNLRKSSVAWSSNFYVGVASNYWEAGGNGGAMRIQPHCWSFPRGSDTKALVRDIVRNTITTHGHPRAILGAVLHGLCLWHTITKNEVPDDLVLNSFIEELTTVNSIVSEDQELSYIWLPQWERLARKSFAASCAATVLEIKSDLALLQSKGHVTDLESYLSWAMELRATSPECRGSGIKTSLLATKLAREFQGRALEAVTIAANALETDTDTVASLTGALLGCLELDYPQFPVQDMEYIVKEAERMYRVSEGRATQDFVYPDLLRWNPPSSHLDAVSEMNGRLVFSAFGDITQVGKEYQNPGRYSSTWRWYRSQFDQLMLIQHRPHPRVSSEQDTVKSGFYRTISEAKSGAVTQPPLLVTSPPKGSEERKLSNISVDEAFTIARRSGFSPDVIGEMLIVLANSDEGVERAIGFAALVGYALKERKRTTRK